MNIKNLSNKEIKKILFHDIIDDAKKLFEKEKSIGFVTFFYDNVSIYFFGKEKNYSIKYFYGRDEIDLSDLEIDKFLLDKINKIYELGGVPSKELLNELNSSKKNKRFNIN